MNIIFDNIIFSLQKSGGISVVWYEILHRVLQDKNSKKVFVEYNDASNNIFRNALDIPNEFIKLKSSFLLIFKRYFNLRLAFMNDRFIFHSSYYRVSNNKNAINVTTVHDFTYEIFEKGLRKKIHIFQKHKAIRKSELVICISDNTRQDLLKYIPDIDQNKIHVIYNGVSDDYTVIDTFKFSDLPFPTESYVVFVGSRQAHKRFDIAVDVIRNLKLKLVIVGGENLSKNELKVLNSKIGFENFKYMGKVSNKDLNILYNNALCLLYPSVYEGFGIPVIEAQKAGCPVVAFKGSSIEEIAGNTPLLFSKYSVVDISKSISLLDDKEVRINIIQEGLKNSKRFSWDNTYRQMMVIYKTALDQN